MLPRFPLPFHIGTDICHVPRIYKLLVDANGRYGKSFVLKLLSGRERHDRRVVEGLKLLEELEYAAVLKPQKSPDIQLTSDGPGPIEDSHLPQITPLKMKLYPFAVFLSGRYVFIVSFHLISSPCPQSTCG
jgi:hypothetical protein